MYLTNFITDAVISQIVQSSICAFVASIGYFLTLRILDRVSGGHWKHFRNTILPQLVGAPVALAIYYGGRNLSVGLIWYGCFAAVRTFGIPGGS